MKRWKIPALFTLSLGTLLITCFALFLHRGTEESRDEDLPIHPISGTSYSNSSKRHLNNISNPRHIHNHLDHNDQNGDESTHRHNYRKRFSDAIKGVFTDILGKNSTKNNPDESTENNSSRLKRQLEIGSASASAEDPNEDFESSKTTPTSSSPASFPPPTFTRKIFTTKRPYMKILKIKNTRKPAQPSPPSDGKSTEISFSPALSTSGFSTSSEEGKRDGGNSRQENPPKKGKSIRNRFRVPVRSNGHYPSTIKKIDEDQSDSEFPANPKNFTLEVVQVERKVVRKEDGNIPPLFAKGHFNIEPRLLNTKTDLEDRPSVVYNKKSSKEKRYQQRPANRRTFSVEASQESSSAPIKSAESSIEQRRKQGRDRSKEWSKERSRERSLEIENENNGHENTTSSDEKSVVVDLNIQVPHHDTDLTDEDLKDYNDGHSTFGSKGNFTHTIISRNIAGFLPNGAQEDDVDSREGLRKRSGNSNSGEKKIVIEKGVLAERYPENDSGENESPEIYAVPGGRSSSNANESPHKEAFPFSRISDSGEKGGRGERNRKNDERDDLTSPAISTSLDELYKKGHPGVVPAPPGKKLTHEKHPLSDPYGESVDYQSPFSYNPLVDEPPLKFDPESDRFYGNPIPDSKEKLGQSNSPVPVENRSEQEQQIDNYYPPPQIRGSGTGGQASIPQNSEDTEEVGQVTEELIENDDVGPSKNSRKIPNTGFQYGRAYNPPDSDYDGEDYGNIEQGLENGRDGEDADFQAALENNFNNPNSEDDFFDFPGEDGGRVRAVRKEFNAKPDNEVVRIDDSNDYDEPKSNPRPIPVEKELGTPSRNRDAEDYERENNFGFQPPGGTRRSSSVDEVDDIPAEVYDSGFINTLMQFDEEIKKLQEQERRKLLQSHPIPEQIQRTPLQPKPNKRPTTVDQNKDLGYKKQGPPLVISSPGPLEQPPYESDNPSSPPAPDESNTEQVERGVTSTLRVTDDDSENQEEPREVEDEGETDESQLGEVEDSPVQAKERNDEDVPSDETVPVSVSVRSMEEAISGFQPLFKKRSTDGLKENIKEIK